MGKTEKSNIEEDYEVEVQEELIAKSQAQEITALIRKVV